VAHQIPDASGFAELAWVFQKVASARKRSCTSSARRIFAALCEQYPDRYIALIEQPELATNDLKRRTATKAALASKHGKRL
jgi:hypothetical protein